MLAGLCPATLLVFFCTAFLEVVHLRKFKQKPFGKQALRKTIAKPKRKAKAYNDKNTNAIKKRSKLPQKRKDFKRIGFNVFEERGKKMAISEISDFEIEELTPEELKGEGAVTIYAKRAQIREIVKILGYTIDSEGYVLSPEGIRVQSSGSDIKVREIGIIKPANSPHVFIKNNLNSLSEYLASR